MLSSILPMLPPPFNIYAGAAVKYYSMFGVILDDLSILVVGIGAVVVYHAWRQGLL